MEELAPKNDGEPYFEITRPRRYQEVSKFDGSIVLACAKFAFDMTVGDEGAHKSTRSGGLHSRNQSEIFANAFQGKLAEFALSSLLKSQINMENVAPGLETSPLGIWEGPDLVGSGFALEVKSAKSFSNLLLLEEKNWTKEGLYRHGIDGRPVSITHVVLIRISPSIDRLSPALSQAMVRGHKALEKVHNILKAEKWGFDCPGFVDSETLAFMVQKPLLLRQGERLGTRGTRMDATNYYVQAGDLLPIDSLFEKREEERRVAFAAPHHGGLAMKPESEGHETFDGTEPDFDDYEARQDAAWFPDDDLFSPTDVFSEDEGCIDCGDLSGPLCVCNHSLDCSDACELSSTGNHEMSFLEEDSSPSISTNSRAVPRVAERRGQVWTRVDDEVLLSMFQEGKTLEEIAESLGRTVSGVWSRIINLHINFSGLSIHGIPVSDRTVDTATKVQVEKLYQQGKAFSDIAQTTGLSVAKTLKILLRGRHLKPVPLDSVKYAVRDENSPERHGAPWTPQESEAVADAYLVGMKLREIANLQDRSTYAIFSHLFRSGFITEDQLEATVELTLRQKRT